MTREQLIRQNEIALEAFLLHGGVVTVCKTKKPRQNEVTFRNNKFSVYNMGHQKAVTNGFVSAGF